MKPSRSYCTILRTTSFTFNSCCGHLISVKPCKLECAAYMLCRSCAAHSWHMVNSFSVNLRWAKATRCMERTPGASSSLCICEKNRQILVHGKQYANCSQMALHRFAVPSTYTRIWFANRSRVVWEPFGTLVYTRFKGGTWNAWLSGKQVL